MNPSPKAIKAYHYQPTSKMPVSPRSPRFTQYPKRPIPHKIALPLVPTILTIVLLILILRPFRPLDQLPYYTRANKPMPRCSINRARTFLIVFQSRSGSTAISTHLKRHSSVHMTMLEYLDRIGVPVGNATRALAETKKFFDEGIKQGLVPGFKIRSYHILPEVEKWRRLAEEYDTRVIWQYRKNVVKSAIGTYQKEILGDSTAISGIKKDELDGDRCSMGVGCKFRIDNMGKFHELLQKRVRYQDLISAAVKVLDGGRGCTLEVPYEDFLYYPRETVNDVQQFLGLDIETTESDRIKATSDNLCDVVDNFDDLCNHFYACAAWQPYFDDFVNDCRCSNFTTGTVEFCKVN